MIWVKSISLVSGYWNRPDATEKEFRDGWFNSGDIGYLDADGYLFLTDRAKDMVIRGGENVYPLEIESTLMNHPEVIEVAAFGVPDEKMGEEVGMVVRLAAGSSLGASDVRGWLGERLAPFKVPRYVSFTAEALPRNAMQKLLKKDIRTAFIAELSGSAG
jgi:acyl-CoA synthetase (AMP-forming)/AMP-acid ligase II